MKLNFTETILSSSVRLRDAHVLNMATDTRKIRHVLNIVTNTRKNYLVLGSNNMQ